MVTILSGYTKNPKLEANADYMVKYTEQCKTKLESRWSIKARLSTGNENMKQLRVSMKVFDAWSFYMDNTCISDHEVKVKKIIMFKNHM